MALWVVGRKVYYYVFVRFFSVDAEFNIIGVPFFGYVKIVCDTVLFMHPNLTPT